MKTREIHARALAKSTISAIKWFSYTNIPLGLTIQIQHTLVDIVAEYTGDSFDASGAIAAFASPHIARLKGNGYKFGQSEGIVQIPFEASWHILLMDDEMYVADHEFYPYEIPSQHTHRKRSKM